MLGEDSEANLRTAESYAIRYLVYVGRFSSSTVPQQSQRYTTIHYFNQLIPADGGMTVTLATD
jgi:putative hydrolase of the HAD superfamily